MRPHRSWRNGGDGTGAAGAGGGGAGGTTTPSTQPISDPLAGLSAGQLFITKTQQSPDMSAVGSTVVLTGGSTLDVQELYSGKLAKVGRTTRGTSRRA